MNFSTQSGLAVATGVILGLSLVGGSAAGQQSPGYADRSTGTEMTPGSLNSTDRSFATKAAQGNMTEAEMGNLAKQRGSTQQVKDYGKMLVDDHTKANNDLKQIVAKQGLTLPTDVTAAQRREIDRLSKLSGTQFDREFAKVSVKDHRDDIKEFQTEIDHGQNEALKSYASNTMPVLQKHLNAAQNLEKGPISRTKTPTTSR